MGVWPSVHCVCWCVSQRSSWCAVTAREFTTTTGVTAGRTARTTTRTSWTVSDVTAQVCGRLRLKCDDTRAETRFRLSAKRTSSFKSAGATVPSTTGSRHMLISGSNVGYTMFRGSVKSTGYPLHSPVSPSLSLPCVTACRHILAGLYDWSGLHSTQELVLVSILALQEPLNPEPRYVMCQREMALAGLPSSTHASPLCVTERQYHYVVA